MLTLPLLSMYTCLSSFRKDVWASVRPVKENMPIYMGLLLKMLGNSSYCNSLLLAWSVRCFQDPGEPFSASSLERSPSLIWRILEVFFICGAADRSGKGKCCCCCWPFFSFPCSVLWGVKGQKLCVDKRGVKRQKLCISWCIDLSKKLYSTQQISESIPFFFSYFKGKVNVAMLPSAHLLYVLLPLCVLVWVGQDFGHNPGAVGRGVRVHHANLEQHNLVKQFII